MSILNATHPGGKLMDYTTRHAEEMAKAAANQGGKERISLVIDSELYWRYESELARRKEARQRGVSLNSLVIEAMLEHAKKFK